MRHVDLSHEITHGMITYPGIPAPVIRPHMTFEESRPHYANGVEFTIAMIDLAANTGTYLDTPAHRHRGGWDLASLALERIAGVPGTVIRCRSLPGLEIPADLLEDREVADRAVLFDTGFSAKWGTEAYFSAHPHLGGDTVSALVEAGPAVVGIDSLNIDGTADGRRPAHTDLLAAGIPIVEHMTALDQLPDDGFSFFAVPPRVDGMATFPVRAFALVDGTGDVTPAD